MVIAPDGQTKIAQYGQWDGYPDGQGLTALRFLSEVANREKLKSQLDKCRFLEMEGKDNAFVKAFDNTPDSQKTTEQNEWFKNFIDRDLGAEIMERVANSNEAEILLKDSSEFGKDGLFCEWCWVVDFKKNKLISRYNLTSKVLAEFDLENLPNEKEFLAAFAAQEEE